MQTNYVYGVDTSSYIYVCNSHRHIQNNLLCPENDTNECMSIRPNVYNTCTTQFVLELWIDKEMKYRKKTK